MCRAAEETEDRIKDCGGTEEQAFEDSKLLEGSDAEEDDT